MGVDDDKGQVSQSARVPHGKSRWERHGRHGWKRRQGVFLRYLVFKPGYVIFVYHLMNSKVFLRSPLADSLSWSQVKLNAAYRRLSHTATQVGSYLFIWGGHNGTTYTSDLLLFNLGESFFNALT